MARAAVAPRRASVSHRFASAPAATEIRALRHTPLQGVMTIHWGYMTSRHF
jgi:hypothetical protein